MFKIIVPIAASLRQTQNLKNICAKNGETFSSVENWTESEGIQIKSEKLVSIGKSEFYFERNSKSGSDNAKTRYSLYAIKRKSDRSDEFEGKLEVLQRFIDASTDTQIFSCFQNERYSALLAIVPIDYENRAFSIVSAESPTDRFEYYRNVGRVLQRLKESNGSVLCIEDYASFGWAREAPEQLFLMDFRYLFKTGTRVTIPESKCTIHKTRREYNEGSPAVVTEEWSSLGFIGVISQTEKAENRIEWNSKDSANAIAAYNRLIDWKRLLTSFDNNAPSIGMLREDIRTVRLELIRKFGNVESGHRVSPLTTHVEEGLNIQARPQVNVRSFMNDAPERNISPKNIPIVSKRNKSPPSHASSVSDKSSGRKHRIPSIEEIVTSSPEGNSRFAKSRNNAEPTPIVASPPGSAETNLRRRSPTRIPIGEVFTDSPKESSPLPKHATNKNSVSPKPIITSPSESDAKSPSRASPTRFPIVEVFVQRPKKPNSPLRIESDARPTTEEPIVTSPENSVKAPNSPTSPPRDEIGRRPSAERRDFKKRQSAEELQKRLARLEARQATVTESIQRLATRQERYEKEIANTKARIERRATLRRSHKKDETPTVSDK